MPFAKSAMCNLYSITRSQDAMRRLFRVGRDLTGNLPLLPADSSRSPSEATRTTGAMVSGKTWARTAR